MHIHYIWGPLDWHSLVAVLFWYFGGYVTRYITGKKERTADKSMIASLEVELMSAKAAFAHVEDHAKLLELKCHTLEHRLKVQGEELEKTLQANEAMTTELLTKNIEQGK